MFGIQRLWRLENITDVTLACEGGSLVGAHKIILVMSSGGFQMPERCETAVEGESRPGIDKDMPRALPSPPLIGHPIGHPIGQPIRGGEGPGACPTRRPNGHPIGFRSNSNSRVAARPFTDFTRIPNLPIRSLLLGVIRSN